MIIDAHVHILAPRMRERRDEIAAADPWFAACHDGGKRVATAEELIASMDQHGIDRSICFAWPFRDPALCAEANDYIAGVQREFPDRVTGFATVNPAAPGAVDELRRCARLGLRGVGEVNCDAYGVQLDDPAVDALATASVELGMPWTLHCSEPVGHSYAGKGTTTPDKVERFHLRHPDLQLICAHLGGGLPFYAHMPDVAATCRSVWFDTAAMPLLYQPSAYKAVVELCGADRLLFGSDYPLIVDFKRYSSGMHAAGLSEDELRVVNGEAAAALFGI